MIFLLIQKDRQSLGKETEKSWKEKERYRVMGPRETSRTMKHKLEGHFFQRRDTRVYAVKQAAPFVVAELILF